MKHIICIELVFMTLSFGCKCRIAQNPLPMAYKSMAISKENNAFINELRPESPFLRMGGRDYYITEAWLERSHLERNLGDIPTANNCVVINFRYEKNFTTDLHSYVKENGNDIARIWFNLSDEEFKSDTLVVHYRETLDSSKKNKTFFLFRRRQ